MPLNQNQFVCFSQRSKISAMWLRSQMSDCVLVYVVVIIQVSGFNVEDRIYQRIVSPKSSNDSEYFGYQFSSKIFSSTNGPSSKFLIGSPKAQQQTTSASENDSSAKEGPSISSPGDLFSCSFLLENKSVSCVSVRPPVNTSGDGRVINDKDSMGLTIATSPNLSENVTVCAPLRLRNCSTNFLTYGTCYTSDDFGKSWLADEKAAQKKCVVNHLDLMFVIDGSASVDPHNFEIVKTWIKKTVAGEFHMENFPSIGVVQYSSYYEDVPLEEQPHIKVEIPLGEYTSSQEFETAVDGIVYQSLVTATAHAINRTVLEFKRSIHFNDTTSRKILVLLTDGWSTDSQYLEASSNYSRSLGIDIFAVGVAEYSQKELLIITGNQNRIFPLQNFTQLDEIVDTLQRSIKETLEGGKEQNVTNELQHSETGLAGFSSDTGALYLGAVGAYDWSGTIVKYDSANDETPDIPDFAQVQLVLEDRTKESYLGYAITSGFFNGESRGEFVAIGAPRYKLKGAVVIYLPRPNNAEFTNARTILPNDQNSQLGSYFGGSLLAMDLNADGRDDLLVGAPLFIDNTYDDGRVYVYIAPSTGSSHSVWARRGNPPSSFFKTLSGGSVAQGSRFGTAMASAGDLNDDGFNDVIIGAPYANDNRGAVFVFHGRADGIDINIKQVIQASQLPNTYLRYFGLSLQGGQDLDNNGYPDIAVGAPKSDTVVIFRSRPVAKFTGSLEFNREEVEVFECFATGDRACLELTACLKVNGTTVEDIVNVDFGLDLDSMNTNPDSKRVQFQEGDSTVGTYVINRTADLQLNKQSCWNFTVYAKRSITDYNTPIEAVFTYKLSERHLRQSLSSVRDPTISNQEKASTSFATGCNDDTCKYDLGIDASLQLPAATTNGEDITENRTVLVISQETARSPILVRVNLTNSGENAFRVRVVVNYTSPLSWTNLANAQSSNTQSGGLSCIDDAQEDSNDETSRVKVLTYRFDQNQGNILPRNHWCYFEFSLSSNTLSSSGRIPEMRVSVTAGTGAEVTYEEDVLQDNNEWTESAPIRYRADATAQERIPETTIPFNFTDADVTINNVKGIGNGTSDVQIYYSVNGRGHSNIPQSTIQLSFPYRLPGTTEDDMMHLLYLYRYTCEAQGNAECECDNSVVNPYNLSESFVPEDDENVQNITLRPNPNFINETIYYDCSENGNAPPEVCATLRCTVTNLGATSSVDFRAFFRLWTHSFNFGNSSAATLTSQFRFSTEDSNLLINENGEDATVFTSSTNTNVRLYVPPDVLVNTNTIWIYIVAAIGGLLLLIIIVIILWKTGFFKSKYAEKKEQMQWNEPNGDEASTADIVAS